MPAGAALAEAATALKIRNPANAVVAKYSGNNDLEDLGVTPQR
jgi:hypothetical protein